MGISIQASNKILNFILGRESANIPTSFYCGISTTPAGFNGESLTEPVDPAYKRVEIKNDKESFSYAADKMVSIIKEYVFDDTSQSWGMCVAFGLYDAIEDGNLWFYGELQTPTLVGVDVAIAIPPNANQFSFDILGGSTTLMSMTTSIANKIINYILGLAPNLIPPERFYLGVSTTPISVEGIGMTEPQSSEYERLEIPNDKNSFTISTDNRLTFAKEFRFPTSATNWGEIKYFFISDAKIGGEIWWAGKLVNTRNVSASTTLTVKPDGFVWTISQTEDLFAANNASVQKTNKVFWG